MVLHELLFYCLEKKGAYLDNSFGKEPILVKVNHKVFAEIYPKEDNYKITLKCEPSLADYYRSTFPNVVVRGYHCPSMHQPYRNTVYINKTVSDELLREMIDHSYDRVLKGFSGKVRQDIEEGRFFQQHMKLTIEEDKLEQMLEGLLHQLEGENLYIIKEQDLAQVNNKEDILNHDVIIYVHSKLAESKDAMLSDIRERAEKILAAFQGKVFEIEY